MYLLSLDAMMLYGAAFRGFFIFIFFNLALNNFNELKFAACNA